MSFRLELIFSSILAALFMAVCLWHGDSFARSLLCALGCFVGSWIGWAVYLFIRHCRNVGKSA